MNYKLMTEDFAKALVQSEIYTEYLQANEELCKNEALKEQMDEYRYCLVKMQMAKDANATVSDEDQIKVSSLYSKLILNECGANFLEKEQRLVRMLKDVAETIYQSLPMDLSFLQ